MSDPTIPRIALISLKNLYRGFATLINAVVVECPRKDVRMRVRSWRRSTRPTEVVRFALTAQRLGIPLRQAMSWWWRNIPVCIAAEYLPHRWRAAEARRVATALRQRDLSLTCHSSLHEGLSWAESGRTGDECLAFITRGYSLTDADALELSVAHAHLDHGLGEPGGPSTIAEWLHSGIAATWSARYAIAGISDVKDALVLDRQRLSHPEGFPQALDLIAALGRGRK